MIELTSPLPDTISPPGQQGERSAARTLRAVLADYPVLLAPMEDISDIAYRSMCREQGADMSYTEFINVDGLLRNCRVAARKIALGPDEWPVGIQIYGSDPALLVEAARVAELRGPTVIDINCGCWVPAIARRGQRLAAQPAGHGGDGARRCAGGQRAPDGQDAHRLGRR